ncbi:MAG: aldehyde dehydrogenase family protein [Syntrophaceae bacterium]|nr:aldehyde dehydrogenase family protein [Syntrophaceae bacterium]
MMTPSETIKNPATGETIATRQEHTKEDLLQAVNRARTAQKAWEILPFARRGRYILAMRDYLVHHADEAADVISACTGKPPLEALATEVIPTALAAGYYAAKTRKFLKRKRLMPGNVLFASKISYIDQVPYGVIGIISPWNYPLAIPLHEVMMALMAGNAVVLKVATQSQTVGTLIDDMVKASGLPEGLFSLIHLPGNSAGQTFIASGIDKLFFTGSVDVGKQLMGEAAARLLPICLELGGNDAMIVCDDANLNRAAGGAVWAGFSNAGQSCGGVERIFVLREVHDRFIAHLAEKTAQLVGSDGEDSAGTRCAMTTKDQWEKVQELLQDALSRGAQIAASVPFTADSTAGFFHPAVVLTNVDTSMRLMNEEIFGPVIAVMAVADEEEAVTLANRSSLGLTASVWTKSRKRAHAIASRLEVGAVTINDHLMSHGLAETPWGGFKESGIGRSHGYLGLHEMTRPRVVVDDYLPGVQKNMWWHPYSKKVYEGLRDVLYFLYGPGLLHRAAGFVGMTRLFLRTFRSI